MDSGQEGERYLDMLGLKEMADRDIKTRDGLVKARYFLDICGPHALPAFKGFEQMDPDDPSYELAKSALADMVMGYINR